MSSKKEQIEIDRSYNTDGSLDHERLYLGNFEVSRFIEDGNKTSWVGISVWLDKEECTVNIYLRENGEVTISRMDKIPELSVEDVTVETIYKAMQVMGSVKLLNSIK